MNQAHIHLLFNHFPIIGTLIGSRMLLYSIIQKQDTGAFIIVIMAITATPVLLSGAPAEGSFRHLGGICKTLIHDHEAASEKAFWLMEITGVISLLALVLYKIKSAFTQKTFMAAFTFSVVFFFAMSRAGNLEKEIRHPETAGTLMKREKDTTNAHPENTV